MDILIIETDVIMDNEHCSFQDEIRAIHNITKQVAFQITKNVTLQSTNPNDPAIRKIY
jgi:hypothetical protein